MSNATFTQWLKVPRPIIRTETHEYKFRLCRWGHKWEPYKTEHRLSQPRGDIESVLHGFRLVCFGKWDKAIPTAQKRPIGGVWSDIAGLQALAEITDAHTVSYQVIESAPLIPMNVVSDWGWDRRKSTGYERGDIELESVSLLPSIADVEALNA